MLQRAVGELQLGHRLYIPLQCASTINNSDGAVEDSRPWLLLHFHPVARAIAQACDEIQQRRLCPFDRDADGMNDEERHKAARE